MTSKPHILRQGGFTLTELLVVIAIIAVLAALIFPIATAMQDSAKAAQCTSKLRQVGQAVLAYRAENAGFLPPNQAAGGGNPDSCWVAQIRPNFGIRETDRTAAAIKAMAPNVTCPVVKDTEIPKDWWDSNYLVNRTFGLDGVARKGMLENPAQTMMLAESKSKLRSVSSKDTHTLIAYRHRSRANVMYFDGHVAALTKDEVPTSLTDPFWATE
jgi:prepilin-type N-terminal cleavage/methylation domain-containing protein/prepilin-type processing-associated H-X9-DG protein